MNSQFADLSLSDLRELRSTWLEQGRRDAPKLLTVVRALGANVKARPVTRAFDPNEFKQIDAGAATAYYVRSTGTYNPALKEYNTFSRLWIELRGETVVNLYYVNDQLDPSVHDAVFIPGAWVDALLAMEPTARAALDLAQARNDEKERGELLALLGIGKVI
jgi:hypothetical protein